MARYMIKMLKKSLKTRRRNSMISESIKELLVIAVASALVSNVVLSQFYGLCPFLEYQNSLKQLVEWVQQLYL